MSDQITEIVRQLNELKANQARMNAQDYPYQTLYFTPTPGIFARPITATTALIMAANNPTSGTIFISRIEFKVLVGANDVSNYWTLTIQGVSAANAAAPIGSVNTSAEAAGVWPSITLTLNQSFTLSALSVMRLDVAKVGTPGNLFFDGVPCAWISLN